MNPQQRQKIAMECFGSGLDYGKFNIESTHYIHKKAHDLNEISYDLTAISLGATF
jgi:hypothetical protein